MKVSSTMEWIYYTDWCYANRMTADDITVRQWLQLAPRQTVMKHQGGLLPPRLEDVGRLIDGSPFPQIITAKLETFCLQARRVPHNKKGEPPPPPSTKKGRFPRGWPGTNPGRERHFTIGPTGLSTSLSFAFILPRRED